jgi:phosphotransferase system IIA component
MPATFITLSKQDIFQSGGAADAFIDIPGVRNIISKDSLAVYNTISVQLGETIQYFLTFDDVIKYIHFGKGLGTLTVEGMLFSDCDANIPGLKKYKQAFSLLRGEQIDITILPMVLTCVMTGSQFTILSEPDTMAQFAFSFSIVNHTL